MQEARAKARFQRLVFGIHGIRTDGGWQDRLAEVLAGGGLRLSSFRYGYFGFRSFVQPDLRCMVVRSFRSWFKAQTAGSDLSDPAVRPSIIGHSFGATVVAEALLGDCGMKVHSIILCGAILPLNFPWDVLLARGQVESIRNECGGRDFWVNVVSVLVPGMGASGYHGFSCSSPRLCNMQYRHYGHCDYLQERHFAEHWVPYLGGSRAAELGPALARFSALSTARGTSLT